MMLTSAVITLLLLVIDHVLVTRVLRVIVVILLI